MSVMESCRVLLIEDNPDDEFLASWVLKRIGLEHVSVARDGREALEMLSGGGAALSPSFDLVILDLRLPKIDGIKVLQRIREDARTAMLPVVVLSSSDDPGDRAECSRLGIIDLLVKPLQPDEIRRILDLVCKG